MRFWFLLYWSFCALGLVVFVTQVALPLLRGRALFPIMRKRNYQVESALATAREDKDVRAVEKEIEAIQPKIQPKRGKR